MTYKAKFKNLIEIKFFPIKGFLYFIKKGINKCKDSG